jgi:hypothetical protein
MIVEPVALFAEDLADCIREARPGAEVAVTLTLAEALARIDGDRTVTFVNATLLVGDGAARLRERSLATVVTGVWDRSHDLALDIPFTPESVGDVLRGIAET